MSLQDSGWTRVSFAVTTKFPHAGVEDTANPRDSNATKSALPEVSKSVNKGFIGGISHSHSTDGG